MPPAPKQLIDAYGNPIFGNFDTSVEDLAVNQFNFTTVMDKPASSFKKHFSFKQFQFACIHTEQYIIGAAITDIRYAGNAFLYLYNKKTKQLIEHSWLLPPSLFYQLSKSPFNGIARVGNKKKFIEFKISDGSWHISIHSAEIEANLCLENKETFPLAMCTPTAYNGWTYTEKRNALKVTGELKVHQKMVDISTALAGYDFSAGFMRRETNWRWASINAHSQGKTIGLNLANGVNETGSNENTLWLEGKRYRLPPVNFDFKRRNNKKFTECALHIFSESENNPSKIDLNFTADNVRQERINIGVIKSNFRQYIGHFEGNITTVCGQKIELNSCPGLTEDHYAKW